MATVIVTAYVADGVVTDDHGTPMWVAVDMVSAYVLSTHARMMLWSAEKELNLRPLAYQTSALDH